MPIGTPHRLMRKGLKGCWQRSGPKPFPFLGLRYSRPAKVVKEKVGRGGQQISWHLAAQAQEKAAHGAVFDTSCPGNERCAVDLGLHISVSSRYACETKHCPRYCGRQE
jgi:hypothetical protein